MKTQLFKDVRNMLRQYFSVDMLDYYFSLFYSDLNGMLLPGGEKKILQPCCKVRASNLEKHHYQKSIFDSRS